MNLTQVLNRISTGRALLIGLILAAFYYFLFLDQGMAQKAQIKAAQQEITTLQNQIKTNQAKLDRAEVYKKTAAEAGTSINKLLAMIPEQFGVSDLEKILSNEAKVAGSSLDNMQPDLPKISTAAKEFEEISVRIDLSGSFLQQMIFLSNLTKIPQILIVRKFTMDMNGQQKGDESPNIHMSAEIVAYRYRGSQLGGDANKGNQQGP